MGKRGLIISPEGIVYGGFDESNHGHFPEYFSLVLSGYSQDAEKSLTKISKAKKATRISKILGEVRLRGHTFLSVRKSDSNNITPNKLIGYIIASLSEDFLPQNLDVFNLYVDGKLEATKSKYLQDLLLELYGFSNKQIKIFSGGDFDRRYPIVNFADCMSRYYFNTELSAKNLSKNANYRELQYFN